MADHNPPAPNSKFSQAAYTLYNFTADSLEGQDALPRELIWGAQGLAFLTMVKVNSLFGASYLINQLPRA